MSGALDPTLQHLDDCDCCHGIEPATPVTIDNNPGLSAITYRVGVYSQFKDSLLDGLSGKDVPALQALTARAGDDYTIALLDAWAMVADVLTFYQERIANECYLRTATERFSVLQLARLIGYELRPGVAASGFLAFTMDTAATSPQSAMLNVPIQVQSAPAPGETAQTFETIEPIEARPAWNAWSPATTISPCISGDDVQLLLQGVNTQLRPGDAILIVGDERLNKSEFTAWKIRILNSVVPNSIAGNTLVTWSGALNTTNTVPTDNVRVYAFRQRAQQFGYNAANWFSISDIARQSALFAAYGAARIDPCNYNSSIPSTWGTNWPSFNNSNAGIGQIDLDAVYPRIVPGSWVGLISVNGAQLYNVQSATSSTRQDFGLSTGCTTLKLDTSTGLAQFGLRETVVFAQTDELQQAQLPLTVVKNSASALLNLSSGMLAPVEGSQLQLSQYVDGLQKGHEIIISGKRPRVIVNKPGLILSTTDIPPNTQAIRPNDSLQMLASAAPQQSGGTYTWVLQTRDGFQGQVTAGADGFTLIPSLPTDPTIAEYQTLSNASNGIILEFAALNFIYDRSTVVVYGNVAAATHGESVAETLGTGDATQTFQSFTLKQSPLTFTTADNDIGAASTLSVFVNETQWHEVPYFLDHGPQERIFITRNQDDQTTLVEFGDGQAGSRLPTGTANIRGTYRKGLGLDGLLQPGQLSQLLTRPLGLKAVTNPIATTGAQDSEVLDDARSNAPTTVLTMARVVSLEDYEDFASTFRGVGKAMANWTWDGQTRGVFLTLAGDNGALFPPGKGNPTYCKLINALRDNGDPFVPITGNSYRPIFFQIKGSIKLDPDQPDKARAAMEQSLRTAFAFTARNFGQPVELSEVIALMQDNPGVIAVNILNIYRTGDDPTVVNTRLIAALPGRDSTGAMQAGELIMLDPAPLDLGVMP